MLNIITNTGIVNRSYTSRGLIVHHASTDNLVRATDGTLWAGVRQRHLRGQINLYRSIDGGFTWQNVFRGSWPTGVGWGTEVPVRPERANGAFISLNAFEDLNKIILWHSFYVQASDENRMWPFIFNMETGERDLDEVPSNTPSYQVGADELAIKCVYNENMIYMIYTHNGRVRVRTFQPARITLDRTTTTTASSGYTATFDAEARDDGLVDIVAVTNSEQVVYFRYNDENQTFTSPVTISQAPSKVSDLSIVRDGSGVLMVTWGTMNGVINYARSPNNGGHWQVSNLNVNGTYLDFITGEPATRVSSLAGLSGFLISYTADRTGPPRTYVRTLSPTGVLGEERTIAPNETRPVVGAKFFKPPATKLMDISTPGHARVAYQVGEGNSATGIDTVPVRFGQELLLETAYPERLVAETPAPPVDDPAPAQRLVKVKVIPGPSQNIDYFAEGMTGFATQKTMQAFDKIGTPVRILRYDPSPGAEVNDRSAYKEPEEYVRKVIVTAMSYEAPFPTGQDDFTTHIERDVRRLHIPPDIHLEREFILNAGNYLKRTVWTLFFGGNEYEISQVVPSFLKGQISHYTANAYVVGPSNDPFSRKTLPSET